jgi:hypothetical protein
MDFEKAVELLQEFDYKKNGKELTINFLIFMLNELVNGE